MKTDILMVCIPSAGHILSRCCIVFFPWLYKTFFKSASGEATPEALFH